MSYDTLPDISKLSGSALVSLREQINDRLRLEVEREKSRKPQEPRKARHREVPPEPQRDLKQANVVWTSWTIYSPFDSRNVTHSAGLPLKSLCCHLEKLSDPRVRVRLSTDRQQYFFEVFQYEAVPNPDYDQLMSQRQREIDYNAEVDARYAQEKAAYEALKVTGTQFWVWQSTKWVMR